jgi:aspartyl-tRNA(Asn)/glutamyl-tRNA(Gln) amidotransferase subunit C
LALSHDEVRQIAELAKLQLTDAEIAQYATQLSDILVYFEKLSAVDTSQIEATASVLPLRNVWRPDISADPLTPAQAVANAPEAHDQQFVVNAVSVEEE